MDFRFTPKDNGEQRTVVQGLTSMMPPSCFLTIFWKDFPSRFSFPLAELTNVVTMVLMADSISKERKEENRLECGN